MSRTASEKHAVGEQVEEEQVEEEPVEQSPWWKRLFEWTDFRNKTGFEFLEPLAVPVILGLASILFSW